MKYLGIDIGEKRVGVAISDEMGIIAREKGVYNTDKFALILKEILLNEKIEKIIIGRPRNASGNLGFQFLKTVKFVDENLLFAKDMICWEDETLTTLKAENELKEKGFNSKEIKNRVDSVAAKIILQGFLNHK